MRRNSRPCSRPTHISAPLRAAAKYDEPPKGDLPSRVRARLPPLF
jgi:hypothetical protein